ncbi:hypothetical protein Hdeb2414_s0002g00061881 [Helianthus debilis subsp. tardiflorus]
MKLVKRRCGLIRFRSYRPSRKLLKYIEIDSLGEFLWSELSSITMCSGMSTPYHSILKCVPALVLIISI